MTSIGAVLSYQHTRHTTDGNGRPIFSYFKAHETSRKYETSHSLDGERLGERKKEIGGD